MSLNKFMESARWLTREHRSNCNAVNISRYTSTLANDIFFELHRHCIGRQQTIASFHKVSSNLKMSYSSTLLVAYLCIQDELEEHLQNRLGYYTYLRYRQLGKVIEREIGIKYGRIDSLLMDWMRAYAIYPLEIPRFDDLRAYCALFVASVQFKTPPEMMSTDARDFNLLSKVFDSEPDVETLTFYTTKGSPAVKHFIEICPNQDEVRILNHHEVN